MVIIYHMTLEFIMKFNSLKKFIPYFLISIIIISILNPLNVLAIDTDFYSLNDILFYNPDDCVTFSSATTNTADGTKMPYDLPATSGKAGYEEAIDSTGHVKSGGKVTFDKHASLGKEYQDYYITMRWNYVSWNWDGTSSKPVDNKQMNWFASAPRIVLVTNQRTGKSINAVALEAGPQPWAGIDTKPNNIPKQGWVNPQKGTPSTYTGRVAGFPPTAVHALGMKQGMWNGSGDVLTYQWAPDQTVKPGPTGDTAASSTTNGCNSSNSAGEYGWDLDGAHAMVYYDQSDRQWSSKPFGSGTIGDCGCGPTSLAMIVATLTGDKSVNPQNMAAFYAANGGQSGGCPSSWNWKVIEKKYPVKVTDLSKDLDKAKTILKNGGLVLFSWEKGPFTHGGHIMVLRKYSPDGKLYIASSGGSINYKQSKEAWDESMFVNGFSGTKDGRSGPGYLKGMWGIEKNE